MQYSHIAAARFIDRPNRFIAHVELDGAVRVCHVKNTGRCRELLTPGAEVWVRYAPAPGRKTDYDLIAVDKGGVLINMDAAAPNAVFAEWARSGAFLPELTLLRPETVHGDSRFDFYAQAGSRRGFIEVKGVTLEENGVVRFPDAPTQRGVKHLRGLIRCVEEGLDAWAVFVIQMERALYFEPNRDTHPEFADALRDARDAGVSISALTCSVTPDSISILGPVEVRL